MHVVERLAQRDEEDDAVRNPALAEQVEPERFLVGAKRNALVLLPADAPVVYARPPEDAQAEVRELVDVDGLDLLALVRRESLIV